MKEQGAEPKSKEECVSDGVIYAPLPVSRMILLVSRMIRTVSPSRRSETP